MRGFISGFSILFHWSIFLSLCQYHTILSLFSAKSCPTLCNHMDCSSLGSSVHGILQARIPERVAILFSRGPSQPRDRIWVSHVGRLTLYHLSSRKDPRSTVVCSKFMGWDRTDLLSILEISHALPFTDLLPFWFNFILPKLAELKHPPEYRPQETQKFTPHVVFSSISEF